VQNTKNLILMNYKIKKKKNQSYILNKNHHIVLNEKVQNQATPTVATIILNDFFKCLPDDFISDFLLSSLLLTDDFLLNDSFLF